MAVRGGGLLVYGRRTPRSRAEDRTCEALPARLSADRARMRPTWASTSTRSTSCPSSTLPFPPPRLGRRNGPCTRNEERTAWPGARSDGAPWWRSAPRADVQRGHHPLVQPPLRAEPPGAARMARATHPERTGAILFDEYHNGYGSRETRPLWTSFPPPPHAGLPAVAGGRRWPPGVGEIPSAGHGAAAPTRFRGSARSISTPWPGLLERAGATTGGADAAPPPGGRPGASPGPPCEHHRPPRPAGGTGRRPGAAGPRPAGTPRHVGGGTTPMPDEMLRAAREVHRILEHTRRSE